MPRGDAWKQRIKGLTDTDLDGDSLDDIAVLYEWRSFSLYFTLESPRIEYSPPSILSIEHDSETPTVGFFPEFVL